MIWAHQIPIVDLPNLTLHLVTKQKDLQASTNFFNDVHVLVFRAHTLQHLHHFCWIRRPRHLHESVHDSYRGRLSRCPADEEAKLQNKSVVEMNRRLKMLTTCKTCMTSKATTDTI